MEWRADKDYSKVNTNFVPKIKELAISALTADEVAIESKLINQTKAAEHKPEMNSKK